MDDNLPTLTWEEFCASCDATRTETPDPVKVANAVGPICYAIVENDDEVWINRSQGGRRDIKLDPGLSRKVVTILRQGFNLLRKGRNGPTVMWKNRHI